MEKEYILNKCKIFWGVFLILLIAGSFSACSRNDESRSSDYGPFDLRDALDRETENATLDQLVSAVKNLSGDNFFLVMSHAEGFIQTMYTEEGFHVEYSHADGYFHGSDYLTEAELITLFSSYYQGDESWTELVDWEEWNK